MTKACQGQAVRERWRSARVTSSAPSPEPVSPSGSSAPTQGPPVVFSRTFYVLAAILNIANIINSFHPNASL